MGHVKQYIVVNKRSEIGTAADDFAALNVDRLENPTGSYHGNLSIHDCIVCDSEAEAREAIDRLDTGFYSDHAVRFYDKSALKPTKQMLAIKERREKMVADRNKYKGDHAVTDRKSAFTGCSNCGSKLSVKHLRGNVCPVCGKTLLPDYVVARLAKYEKDITALDKEYANLHSKQSGKCPVKWLVKVEVHC